jgi:hypothetical protein
MDHDARAPKAVTSRVGGDNRSARGEIGASISGLNCAKQNGSPLRVRWGKSLDVTEKMDKRRYDDSGKAFPRTLPISTYSVVTLRMLPKTRGTAQSCHQGPVTWNYPTLSYVTSLRVRDWERLR